MGRPTAEELSTKLLHFIESQPEVTAQLAEKYDANWRKSGVYSVLDCVFSSMAKFKTVVVPTLQRFGESSGLHDTAELTFNQFLVFVQGQQHIRPTAERFAEVAQNDFANSQKISGRTKVEVAYDVCEFFAARGYQTKADLQILPVEELEKLVMQDMVNLRGDPNITKIRGMGLALGAYLLICLGDTHFVKPDTLLLRLVGRIVDDWQPKNSDENDYLLVRQAITYAGEKLNPPQPAAAVDNALWHYESTRRQA